MKSGMAFLCVLLLLAGCGGSKVVREEPRNSRYRRRNTREKALVGGQRRQRG